MGSMDSDNFRDYLWAETSLKVFSKLVFLIAWSKVSVLRVKSFFYSSNEESFARDEIG